MLNYRGYISYLIGFITMVYRPPLMEKSVEHAPSVDVAAPKAPAQAPGFIQGAPDETHTST